MGAPLWAAALCVASLTAPPEVPNTTPVESPAQRLIAARTWHYQLQRLKPEELASTDYDVLVVDAEDDMQEPWAPDVVDRLRQRPGHTPRVVLAYLSIGEAETYRGDFSREWRRKRPPWLLGENPEWAGNHPVLYWDTEWQSVIERRVERILSQGFDGLYLDRVDVNREPAVVRRLLREHAAPPDERKACRAGLACLEADRRMVAFVVRVAERARAARRGALIVPQNGTDLVASLASHVDGWAVEDTFFHGERRANRKHTLEVLGALAPLKGRLPVFAVDYVRNADRVRELRARCIDASLVPLAAPSRALDRGP